MSIIKDAAEHIEKKEVNITSLDGQRVIIQVKNQTVILEKKAGRREYSCSCRNYSTFCKSPVICSHLMAAITFLVMKKVKI
jgi:hypothetical protein